MSICFDGSKFGTFKICCYEILSCEGKKNLCTRSIQITRAASRWLHLMLEILINVFLSDKFTESRTRTKETVKLPNRCVEEPCLTWQISATLSGFYRRSTNSFHDCRCRPSLARTNAKRTGQWNMSASVVGGNSQRISIGNEQNWDAIFTALHINYLRSVSQFGCLPSNLYNFLRSTICRLRTHHSLKHALQTSNTTEQVGRELPV